MNVNNRLLRILEYLKKKEETSIKEIASDLNINERAVRYEIDNLNYILEMNNSQVIEKEAKGRLVINNALANDSNIDLIFKIGKNSKEERIKVIKLKALLENSINLSSLSKILDVSRVTIKSDLLEIEEELKEQKIFFSKNRIHTEEKNIRNYIMSNYYKEINRIYYENEFITNTFNYKELFKELLDIDIDHIKKFIKEISEKLDNRNNNFYEYIFSYIVISYMRMKKGFQIEEVSNILFLKSTKEYEIVNEKIKILEDYLFLKYTEQEKLVLTDYILGGYSYEYNTSIFENWIEIKLLIKNIINEVNEYMDIDIIQDEELFEGLLNHIKPAIYRIKNNLNIEDEIYFEAIKAYPDLFNIIKISLNRLEKLINKEINNSEIALFTIHFLASIERNKNFRSKKKNILLVCGGGYGTSMLVGKQLEKNYDINITATISYMELLDFDFTSVDIVITTLKLKDYLIEKIKIPVLKITAFFTVEDQELLNESLYKKDDYKEKMNKILGLVKENTLINNNSILERELNKILLDEEINITVKEKKLIDFISKDKIQIIDKVSNWKEALFISGEPLIEKNEINIEYIHEIIHIAEDFGVHFVLENEVAVPHGEVSKNVNKSCISVLSIKEPVYFSEKKPVTLIFLIGAITATEHIKSIEEIINLTKRKEILEKIHDMDNVDELYEFFKLLDKEINS
ncbi:MAG: PTS sugar transporter subunit IIA [Sebaldella sp.]|nr:PTS sugar transporter subunit IIA [Sebaldella sp.]